jgi:type II secretory pathway pseudopilin PulG
MLTRNHNPGQVGLEPIATARGMKGICSARKPSEDGYTLLVVVFLLAILTIAMSVALPKMTRSIQRDHEVETMHRGKQYARAVQLYYRKFHAYPPNMDALVKSNEIRFLRKKYIDPLTGKDDWKPIMFGQNQAPIAMGFFGQALMTGSTLAGIGMSGGNGIAGLNGVSGANGIGGLNGAGGSGIGSQNSAGTLGSIFNSQQSSTTQSSAGGTDANGNPIAGSGTGATDANGNPIAGSGPGATDANGNPIQGTGTNGLNGSPLAAGQTFGGAGIIGVKPVSPKESLLIYKKKSHYNEWEFDYDPSMERTMQGGNTGMIGTPASNLSNPIGGAGFGSTTNTFGGGQTSSTPFGAGPGSGSQSTPTSPQQ